MCLSPKAKALPTTPAAPPPPVEMAGKAKIKKPALVRRSGQGVGNPLVSKRKGSGSRL